MYSAAWTASSSNALHVQLTGKVTLPAGTYVLVYSLPTCSGNATARVYDGTHAWNYTIVYGGSSAKGAAIMTFSASTTVWLASFASASVTYTNPERGGLWAVRIA